MTFLDSWLPCSYPDDAAIKLYNSLENGLDEWTEFLTSTTEIDGKEVLIDEVLHDESLLDEFTDHVIEFLITPLDRLAEEYGYDNMEIIKTDIIRCIDNSMSIYALVKIRGKP